MTEIFGVRKKTTAGSLHYVIATRNDFGQDDRDFWGAEENNRRSLHYVRRRRTSVGMTEILNWDHGSLTYARLVRKHSYYVYIVASRTHVLYIGVTNNIERRVWEHRTGACAGFSSTYRCQRLVWYESYVSVDLAIQREKQLKNWSRSKKITLIEKENPTWLDFSEEWYGSVGPFTPEE